jgi:hypothetical protein
VAGAVVAGSGVLASLACVVFVVRYWKTPVVYSAAPLLLCAIAVGCMITYLSILMRALNECGMNQALYSLGYSVVLAAFYVKSYRIDCVFNSTGLRPSLTTAITLLQHHRSFRSSLPSLSRSGPPKERYPYGAQQAIRVRDADRDRARGGFAGSFPGDSADRG